MKISLNWLNSLLPLTQSPEEIENILTATGLEVEHFEKIESIKGGLRGLIVGKVETCIKHPNADKLNLTKVDIGSSELLSIVCGAPNVEAGQKVIVATVGTTIYPLKGEPFTIQKAKIRGEYSEGMLCAEDEIGMGESHAGLLILDPTTPIGASVAELFNVESDVLFEIGLTANRGDAASHLGVARELATVLNLPFKLHTSELVSSPKTLPLEIEIADAMDCPRYSGLIIENIRVGESPDWLKNRLSIIGLKSINNVVDITNFILHELGQPLHAFDLDKIIGNKIIVKRATQNSSFITLDGVERKLKGHELMICDTISDMCMAGIYGGKDSGVSEKTNRIFLESAYFAPDVIRKAAKAHGLNTDSSFRFERGTDPEMTTIALKRAAALLSEICGATVNGDIIDIYPSPLQPSIIELKRSHINKTLGIDIPSDTISQILTGLGISIQSENEIGYLLSVPCFKGDVTREIDVIEELIRIYGFKHVPLQSSMKMSLNYEKSNPLKIGENTISLLLKGIGFREIMTNSLTADKYYEDKTNLVFLSNPLSAEMNVMRGHMLYSALESIAYNKNRKLNDNRFFEFGKIYSNKEKGFKETNQLLIIVSGQQTNESWEYNPKPVDAHFLKSIVNKVYDAFDAPKGQIELAEVDTKTLQKFGIKDSVFYAVFDWTVPAKYQKEFLLKAIPQFPIVRRDLSLVLERSVQFESIENIIRSEKNHLIGNINVFDVYQGKPLEENQKSISISIDLYDDNKTLTDTEIDPIMEKLIGRFEKEINAVIRK
ncbi:MAG: phenylalanine--tRNA ligase subunit beta [Bacteroidia bacterium]|nr:phenylalanine--tRNA ligase subunit beta [Bacteroidia bacterium]